MRNILTPKMLKYVSKSRLKHELKVVICALWIDLFLATSKSFAVQTEKMTKKKPRFGALPVLHMPRRSHESSKPPGRRSIVRHVKPIEPADTSCYGTFVEFCDRAKSLKTLSEWSYKVLADRFVLKKVVEPYLLQSWKLSWTTVLDSL